MPKVLVVLAALCLVYSFLLTKGDGSGNTGLVGIIGIVLFIVGALLHMQNRRKEQLDAMRGRGNDKDNRNG